jgi:hypothetical protein
MNVECLSSASTSSLSSSFVKISPEKAYITTREKIPEQFRFMSDEAQTRFKVLQPEGDQILCLTVLDTGDLVWGSNGVVVLMSLTGAVLSKAETPTRTICIRALPNVDINNSLLTSYAAWS